MGHVALNDTVDAVGCFVEAVVAELVIDEERDDEACGQTECEARSVKRGITSVATEIAPGDRYVAANHDPSLFA